MKNKIYSLFVALIVCLNAQAIGEFNLEKAEQAYTAAEYDTAIEVYNSALDMGYESADLYYNVANCYYRKGELAASILNYERALKLEPSHEDAQHNLELAQLKTVDKIDVIGSVFFIDWWNAICNITSADTWAIFSIIFFVVTLIALSLYIFVRKLWVRKLGFTVSIIALLFTVVSLFLANSRYNVETSNSSAIVFMQTVTVKSSPDNSGNDLFILHEGTKVNIKSVLGDWVEINTLDGNSGWMPVSAVEII